MRNLTPSFPDLSLQISPPEVGVLNSLYSEGSSSATESGSSGSDLSQSETPKLSLGYEMTDLPPPQPRNLNQIYLKRSNIGVKRSVRAPRMRWTTTLHAHFVHAVQLLGGHESK